MLTFLSRRLGLTLITLGLVSVFIFFATEALPGDAATVILGQAATPQDIVNLREELGLDRAAPVRFFNWFGNAIRGDLGDSYVTRLPVVNVLIRRLGNSVILASAGLVAAVPLAVGLGTWIGVRRDSGLDRILSTVGLIAMSTPEFVTAIVLILLFSSILGMFPASSTVLPSTNPLMRPQILVLPALTVSTVLFGYILRMTRANIIEVMESDYIRTANLKGLTLFKVVLRHALPNAILPTISVIMVNVGWLIGGLVVVENVFAYPGMGSLLLSAISRRDIPTLQGTVLVVVVIYAVSNLVADILYGTLDPRIRYWT